MCSSSQLILPPGMFLDGKMVRMVQEPLDDTVPVSGVTLAADS